jgi:hypothetical protein
MRAMRPYLQAKMAAPVAQHMLSIVTGAHQQRQQTPVR